RLALLHHVAAELARENDEGAIEQAALLEIEHELGHGAVDRLLHVDDLLVAVLVGVPVQERNVLGGHLNEARAGLDEPPRQEAAQPETLHVGLLVAAVAHEVASEAP